MLEEEELNCTEDHLASGYFFNRGRSLVLGRSCLFAFFETTRPLAVEK